MSAFGALCFEREVSCTLPAAGAHWELYRLLCWTQQFVLLAASGFVHRATLRISQSTPCCQLPLRSLSHAGRTARCVSTAGVLPCGTWSCQHLLPSRQLQQLSMQPAPLHGTRVQQRLRRSPVARVSQAVKRDWHWYWHAPHERQHFPPSTSMTQLQQQAWLNLCSSSLK